MAGSAGTGCSGLSGPADKGKSLLIYPTLHNGPIQLFARLIREKAIILEQHDHYLKQTYRNRCVIAGPNGPLTLSIPVKRTRGKKNLFRDIQIDYDLPWNKIHWKSYEAAYAASPFFEYFRDELLSFYEKPGKFLLDLNVALLEFALEIMGITIPLNMTNDFLPLSDERDPRQYIHPKMDVNINDPDFEPRSYHQVFQEKNGFIPNLSILDLLFNEGVNSLTILKESLKT